MDKNDVLTEVPEKCWPQLRDLFKNNWPEDFLGYSAVNNRIDLRKRHPTRGIKIFGLNGDWSDGTCIIEEGIHRSIYTLQPNCDRLKRAMILLNWSSGPKLHPYHVKHKTAVNYTYKTLGCDVDYNGHSTLYWLPKEQALNKALNIPGEVYLASLQPEHALIMNQFWPHKFEGSEMYINDIICHGQSRGVFGKASNDLLAWVLRMNNGVLTALQTHADHLRKGYGSLVLVSMAKLEAENGRDTFGTIIDGNVVSATLFEKVGFHSLGSMFWATNKVTDIQEHRLHST